ncbi:MAG: hypothetical protein FWC16_14785 [Defluviitaleaceae bacterium]|nr:hypothetical protein [Defluviitaleaceae bacterium]MCL2276181.1 hypothetical protein [Defluviitaleaceae bacterium]
MMKKSLQAIALFTGLLGALLSMLEWTGEIFLSLFSSAVNLAGLGDGFLLIANRLFTISEARQLFRYIMFPVTLPEAYRAGNTALALVIISLILLGISLWAAYTRHKIVALLIMLAAVAVQVYFGVFPSAVWNIILFCALALVLANRRGNMALCTLVMIITAVIFAVYPQQNLQLHAFSEALRDRFDTRINPFSVAPFTQIQQEPEHRALAVTAVQDEALHESPRIAYNVIYEDAAHGAEVGFFTPPDSFLPAILFVVFVALAAMFFYFALPYYKAKKQRTRFDTDAPNIAINNMFLHLHKWLGVMGLQHKNVLFSAYAVPLSSFVSPKYASEYAQMVTIWQQAVYSLTMPSNTDRLHMKAFLTQTQAHVWKNAGLYKKLQIKFNYFL